MANDPNQTQSALALYEPSKEKQEEIASDEIDEVIARALGLEDTSDIDYETYKTLLREKMASGRMTGSEMSSEETELFTNEYKRVKGKTGRFVVRVSGTNFDKVVNRPRTRSIGSAMGAIIRVGNQEEQEEEEKEQVIQSIPDSFVKIAAALDSINAVLERQLAIDQKTADAENKAALDAQRAAKEKEKEKKKPSFSLGGMLGGIVKKIPFLDRIKTYLTNVAVGSAVLAFVKWLEDPANQRRIDEFSNFMTKTLPIIFGGLLALLALDIGAKLLTALGALKGLFAFLTSPLFLLSLTGIAVGQTAKQQYETDLNRLQQQNLEEDQIREAQGLPPLTEREKQSREVFDEIEATAPAMAAATGQDPAAAQAGAMFGNWLTGLFRGGEKQYADNELGRAEKEKDRVSGEIKKTEIYIDKLTQQLNDPKMKVTGAMRSNIEGNIERQKEKLSKLQNDLKYAESRMEEFTPEAAPTSQEIQKQILDSTKKGGLYEGYDPSKLQWNYDLGIPELKTPSVDLQSVAKPDQTVKPKLAEKGLPDAPVVDFSPEFMKMEVHPESRRIQQELFNNPPKPQEVSVIPLPLGGSKPKPVASSSANQKIPPSISPSDPNDLTPLMTRSLYNAVG